MNRILLAGWLVLGLSTLAMAQKKEVIKDFKISVAREKLVLTPGTSERIDVYLNRSKRFKNRSIQLSVNHQDLPDGVRVTFGPNPVTDKINWIQLTTEPTTKTGSYFFVVYGETSLLKRGTLVNLLVNSDHNVSTQTK